MPPSSDLRTCPHCGRVETPEDREPRPGLYCNRFDNAGGCGKAYDPDEAKRTLRTVKGGVFGIKGSNSPQIEEFWETGEPEVFGKKKSSQPPMFE